MIDEPYFWAVVWLAVTAGFGIGELTMAGTFFLLPFAAGGLAAAIVSLLGLGLMFSFPVFLLVSFAAFLGLRPLSRRLDATMPNPIGIGSSRLVGIEGTVIEEIGAVAGGSGQVRVGTEDWRADTATNARIPVGHQIRVLEVRGTRLIVEPTVVDFGHEPPGLA